MARKAVDTVLDFVKEKLPDAIADRLDDILEGGGTADLLGGLGNLFGS